MEEDYIQGQLDLIDNTKHRLQKIIEQSKDDDLIFDVIHLLKTLLPLKKNPDHSSQH